MMLTRDLQLNHLGMTVNSEASRVHRRGSHGMSSTFNQCTLISQTTTIDNLSAIPITYLVEVEATLETLMQREDTDEDSK